MANSRLYCQAVYATTPDNPVFLTNIPCTGSTCLGLLPMRYAELGSTVNYDIPYANSGSFQLEVGSSDKLTWVNDYELNDFFNPTASISHWDHSSGNATGFTTLSSTLADPDVYDPDVIQIGDSLYVIDYQVQPLIPSTFPGNGTVPADQFAVVFERFSATEPPVSNGFSEVQNTAVNSNVLYAKKPNIDVSLNGNAAMCWEEQNTTETSNHVYARTFDATNGISTIPFDLNPLSFGYKSFYNPDITSKGTDLRVLNVHGQEVNAHISEHNSHSIEVDLSGLSKGIYFIRMLNGTRPEVFKLLNY